jgi:hypothetical protein
MWWSPAWLPRRGAASAFDRDAAKKVVAATKAIIGILKVTSGFALARVFLDARFLVRALRCDARKT